MKKILILLFFLTLNACAYTQKNGVEEISFNIYNQLAIGQTTYTDAIKIFGNPSDVHESENKIVAVWATENTIIHGLLVPFGSTVESKRTTTTLLFDKESKLLIDHYQRIQRNENSNRVNLY